MTNSYDPEIEVEDSYTLTISKTVVGVRADFGREFYFDVTLADGSGAPYSGSYIRYASPSDTVGVIYSTANGVLALKHGQRAVITSLSEGQTFAVSERVATGYVTTLSVDGLTYKVASFMGYIGGHERVDFTNTFDDGTDKPDNKKPPVEPKKPKPKAKPNGKIGIADGSGTDLRAKTGDTTTWSTLLALLLASVVAVVLSLRQDEALAECSEGSTIVGDTTVGTTAGANADTKWLHNRRWTHWNLDAEKSGKKEEEQA